jgi:eukaryotic-like serine/threonine-protein kinase
LHNRGYLPLCSGRCQVPSTILPQVPTPDIQCDRFRVAAPPDDLGAALADRYRIERDLGRGGMATVYLAHDLKHDRPVALKVMHPELASLGPERFLREIRFVARLQHPHIITVLDSGEAAGQLWYTMPYIRGETLRQRLRQEVQLPVEAALDIVRQVALALDYAHREGVVHRDLKPENILLTEDQALVADFGVAKGLEAGSRAQLTETGMAVGTPTYMSPEQASGGAVDARSDVYALGCVLYEMLAGEPPYTGSTPQAILAKRVLEPVPHVRTLRQSAPEGVEQAITKALATVPADRFQSAAEFARSLMVAPATEAVTAAPGAPQVTPNSRPPRNSRWVLALGLATVAVLVAGGALLWRSRGVSTALDADLVAVAPFDILAPDLQLWREGLVDLLARNLDGAGPLRTVSPTVVIRRWKGRADRSSAEMLAKRTGAGLAIYGSLLPESPDSVRLAAALLDATRAEITAEVEVRGPADQLARLADSLTLRLLAELGRTRPLGATRSGGLGSRSLPAVRAFLRGEQWFRRTAWDSSRTSYERAVELDSAFALAYWRLGAVRGWLVSSEDSLSQAYYRLAGERNHGLPPRESMLITFDSLKGTLDEGTLADSASEQRVQRLFRTAEEATRRYPHDPESWAALGEARVHFGAGRGVSDEMTLSAFVRAIALDSAYALSYIHAWQLAASLDDRPVARRLALGFLALRPERTEAIAARTALHILDRPQPGKLALLLDTVPLHAFINVINAFVPSTDSEEVGIVVGRAFAAGPPAVVGRAFAAGPPAEDWSDLDQETREGLFAGTLAYRGHLREASQLLARHPGVMSLGTFTELALVGLIPADTVEAVFERQLREGPTRAASGLQLRLGFPLPWWMARRDTLRLKRYASRLSGRGAVENMPLLDRYLHAASNAYLALARGDTAEAVARFKALPATVGPVWYERLTLARLLAALGSEREALAVLDREFPAPFAISARGTWALERARLAEKLGEREKALQWYGFVARLWRHGDPELRPAVDEAREALTRLTSEPQ